MQPGETTRPASSAPAAFDPRSLAIFENAFEFFSLLDSTGRIIMLTGRLFERTNTNTHRLVGEPFSETVFWQSSENTARLVGKAVADAAQGQDIDLLVEFRISADEKVPVRLELQLLTTPGVTDAEIFVSARALQETSATRGHADENEQLLRAAENSGIGLWFWDIKNERIYSTPSCKELLGLPAHEPITLRSVLAAVHPDDLELVQTLFKRLESASIKYEEEFRIVHLSGKVDWISAEGKSHGDGDQSPDRMMGVVRSVTTQKLAAGELAKVYEREKRARDEAVEANRSKDFFLAFVSHELRSPLNAILGWSKILLTKTVDESTRRNALETIERSARLQTKLINDLVDSARVASGKLRLEFHPTNLCEVVRVAYQAQKPVAEAHGLEFTFASDCDEVAVFADAGRLQQVITNLISNAIKFTPDGGKVTISIKKGEDLVSLHVQDTGQGISTDALPNIFQQFSQGEIGSSRNSGLGLGLSIVRILVAKHGGSVQAFSGGIGMGSEFVVTLPLSDSNTPETPVDAPEPFVEVNPKSLAEKRILVVEDDPDSREVLQLFLKQAGADVSSADSAKNAMAALVAQSGNLPDIIISDLAMPEEDGYSFLLRVRQMPAERGGAIPAIALSAFTTSESKQKAFESGFQLYSTKPFEPDRLIADIVRLTQTKKQ